MTPAIDLLKKHNTPHTIHSYKHDPKHESYGLEAAQALGVDAEQVFKTLMFCINGEPKNLAVAVIPVDKMLNLKQAAKAIKAKKAEMADVNIAQRTSGYIVGGISPLGQKKPLKTLIDSSAQQFATIYISAGKRGLDIELSPDNLLMHTMAVYAELTN